MLKSPVGMLLLVGVGGFIGAVARFLISGWVQRLSPLGLFPWGTLTVNVAGCLAIGLIGGMVELRAALSAPLRVFWMFGVLGGFTTFSTFALEAFILAREQDIPRLGAYVLLHLVCGFGAAWLGFVAARYL